MRCSSPPRVPTQSTTLNEEVREQRRRADALTRDIAKVEGELSQVTADRDRALADAQALRRELSGAGREGTALKRKLEAQEALLAQQAQLGRGSMRGLELCGLDLTSCVVEVENCTNMDVSLAGWTVRFADSATLRTAHGEAIVVHSPSANGRRDSLVRRHAFCFPFDFMLAAGTRAIIK